MKKLGEWLRNLKDSDNIIDGVNNNEEVKVKKDL